MQFITSTIFHSWIKESNKLIWVIFTSSITQPVCVYSVFSFLDELVGFAHFLLLLLKAMPPFTRQKVVSFLNGFIFWAFQYGWPKVPKWTINFGWVFLFCFFKGSLPITTSWMFMLGSEHWQIFENVSPTMVFVDKSAFFRVRPMFVGPAKTASNTKETNYTM